MEMFRSQAGIVLTHVPYKAIGQATADLISGQVSLWFPTIPGALPHIRSGRMRAMAVAGARRSPALVEIPTVAEAASLPALMQRRGMPCSHRGHAERNHRKLNTEFLRVLACPSAGAAAAQGVESIGSTPQQLAAHLRSELPKWAQVVKAAGVSVD
jgi:tripartite-type tricarboxylate transporter receptor subunit TctC